MRAPYGFNGRLGHVHISVSGEAPDVPRSAPGARRARARPSPRSAIPGENPYQIVRLDRDKHPCSLLTRAEAEAVLGPLVVEPYRASSDGRRSRTARATAAPITRPGTTSFRSCRCGSNGRQDFALNKGARRPPLGGDAAGAPPHQGAVGRRAIASGALQLLKGDRLLEGVLPHVVHRPARRGEARRAGHARGSRRRTMRLSCAPARRDGCGSPLGGLVRVLRRARAVAGRRQARAAMPKRSTSAARTASLRRRESSRL